MPRFPDNIGSKPEFSEESVAESIEENIERLLKKRMSRFAYARAAVSGTEPTNLPPLHLMDHRLRLPALDLSLDGEDASPERLEELISARLSRMLVMVSNDEALEIVTRALRLEPRRDAHLIRIAHEASPRFVNRVLRGRLGAALAIIPTADWGELGESGATKIVQHALIYHSAFQVQLIAARGRAIDRLLLRLIPGLKAYTAAEAWKHLHEVVEAIEKIIEKLEGETKQPPQRALIVDRKEAAEEIRASMPFTDEEIVEQALAFLGPRKEQLKLFKEKVAARKKAASVETLHKAIFEMTSVEALIFAVTRLVQLTKLSPDVQSTALDNLERFIPVAKRWLPSIQDKDVAHLLFVYRALILRDDAASDIIVSTHKIDLLALLEEAEQGGNVYAANTTKKRMKYFGSAINKRERLTRPMPDMLQAGQRVDLLPDFLLQRFQGVEGVVPEARPLALARRKREKDKRHIPPHRWKASGRK